MIKQKYNFRLDYTMYQHLTETKFDMITFYEQFYQGKELDLIKEVFGLDLRSAKTHDLTFSQFSSFAWWIPKGNYRTLHEAGGASVPYLTDYVLAQSNNIPLNIENVIIAVNAGIAATGTQGIQTHFTNFHDKGSKAPKMRARVIDSELEGAYFTDIFKGLPTSDAVELIKLFEEFDTKHQALVDAKEAFLTIAHQMLRVELTDYHLTNTIKRIVFVGHNELTDTFKEMMEITFPHIEYLQIPHYVSSKMTTKEIRQYFKNNGVSIDL